MKHFLLASLGRFLNWRAGVPFLMRPFEWTVSADRDTVRLQCGCGKILRARSITKWRRA